MLDFFKKLWKKVKNLNLGQLIGSGGAGVVAGGIITVTLLLSAGAPLTGPLLLVTVGVGTVGAIVGAALGISVAAVVKDFVINLFASNKSRDDEAKEVLKNKHGSESSYQKISSQSISSENSASSAKTEASYLLNGKNNTEDDDSEDSTPMMPLILGGIGMWFAEKTGCLRTVNVPDTGINAEPPHPGM